MKYSYDRRSSNDWQRLRDDAGWKYLRPEVMAFLMWEDEWTTVRDRDVPDEEEIADPEMLADGIPELMEDYGRRIKDWKKWQRQGWWPKPVKSRKLLLTVFDRRDKRNYEASLKGIRPAYALKKAEEGIEGVLSGKVPRWLRPA